MAKNTRFALGSANRTAASTTTLINGASTGTYPSRPALSEDAQYPMSNLRLLDRYSIWRSANALTGTYDVEWDLGSDLSLDVFAVHNFRRAAGQSSPSTVDISFRTSVSGYSQAGTWIAILTGLSLANRDAGAQLAAPIRGRYIRFRFGVGGTGGGFSIGNLYVGNLSYDLGMIYSPGASDTYVRPERRYPLMGGALVNVAVGDGRKSLSLPFGRVSPDTRTILRTIAKETSPITYISYEDEIMQVLPAPEHQQSHVWLESHDSTLELEQLA